MATPRKKKTDIDPPEETGNVLIAAPDPTPSPGEAPAEPAPNGTNGTFADPQTVNGTPAANGAANGARRKPDQSYKIYSDKTTQLEVAIWENEVRYDDKVSVQHSIVLSRAYKNGEGKWVPSTAYRTYDLPLVRFLMDKAHAWCADRRTQDSSCPF